MSMHPAHMAAPPYPMGPPHHPMPQYMHQRQPSYGGRYDMSGPGMGYYVPVPFLEPTPEPEVQEVKETKEVVKETQEKKENTEEVESVKSDKNSGSESKKENVSEAKTEETASEDTTNVSEDTTESGTSAPALSKKEQLKLEKIEKHQKQKDATISYIHELFESKNLADVTLSINSTEIKLHSIFAARSKILADKLKYKPLLKTQCVDPGNWITDSSASAVIATLYGLPLPSQMRQAQWFGAFLVAENLGLSDVRAEIELLIKKQLVTSQATVTALNSVVQRCMKGSSSNVTVLPNVLTKPSELSKLFDFLVTCLGSLTQAPVSDLATSALVKSPFALYKLIMESSELLEGNTMEKYALAKKLVQPRQKSHPGFQDVAVLAFSSDKDGLEIRRKKA